jgi:hypothetical protein
MDYDPGIEYRLVSYEYNWTFTPIWKNATASIFEAFSNKFLEMQSRHKIHDFVNRLPENDDLKMLHKDSKEYLDAVKDKNNIVCVRDPYERFMSAFYHKIIENPGGMEVPKFNYKKSETIDDIKKLYLFVDYMSDKLETIDPHFQPQAYIANFDNIKYFDIINISNFNNGWNKLAQKYENIPPINGIHKHKTDSKIFADMIKNQKEHSRIVSRIKMLYLDDYNFIRNNAQ